MFPGSSQDGIRRSLELIRTISRIGVVRGKCSSPRDILRTPYPLIPPLYTPSLSLITHILRMNLITCAQSTPISMPQLSRSTQQRTRTKTSIIIRILVPGMILMTGHFGEDPPRLHFCQTKISSCHVQVSYLSLVS